MLEVTLNGLIIIVGGPGSGKTEVSVNIALSHSKRGSVVSVVDLDLVNPYFRAREVRYLLHKHGIKAILPPDKYLNADLPIVTPVVSGVLKNLSGLSILDVGGGGSGSTVLGSLSFDRNKAKVLFIVNPYRPCTNTLLDCIKMRDEIEFSGKVKVSGLIGNSNVIDQTSFDEIYDGYNFMLALSEKLNLPLSFITVSRELKDSLDLNRIGVPFLIIERQLVPPWILKKNFFDI